MKCLFIRHTSVAVPMGVCYGQSDVDVSARFYQEATQVKQRLSQQTIDIAFTSPLKRCTQLASFCGYGNAIQEPRLMEINFGTWEQHPWDEITDPHLQHWFNDWINTPATNGESFMDLFHRFHEVMDELHIHYAQRTIAIFTHGGIINCARVYAGITDFTHVFEKTPAYGSITPLTIIPHHSSSLRQ